MRQIYPCGVVATIKQPTSGRLEITGLNTTGALAQSLCSLRLKVQMVFQNPYGPLNRRQKIGSILEEPLLVNTNDTATQRAEKVRAMIVKVGLRPEHYHRYPQMFSDGQCQRIAITRALMLEPDILVLDEPASALNISIQAHVINLLADMQEQHDSAYLFISHDLSVVKHIGDEAIVMYLGHVVEHGEAKQLFSDPLHPYTKALLSATPQADPMAKRNRIVLQGELPSPLNPPSGCAFRTRCAIAVANCSVKVPALRLVMGRSLACNLVV